MEDGEHPLLSSVEDDQYHNPPPHSKINHDFAYDEDDVVQGTGIRYFIGEFYVESKKLWYLAAPAIITSLCQYSLGAISQVFAGQLGTTELAMFSVENSIIAGFSCGIMWGLGSALETLCGIAYGAGQLENLGIYMQRSWIILNTTALMLMFTYIFATPILKFIGQTEEISEEAGIFAQRMIPQLFAYAMNYPLTKFLQAQNRFMAMAVISVVALFLHTVFSWLLMLKLGWGMVGAAVVLNSSWWFIVLAEIVYIFGGACGRTWTGFSWMAFHNLWGFLKLSLASAAMLGLQTWYTLSLTLLAGYLKNTEVSVDASSIGVNIWGWTTVAALGLNSAISVRVSNELGATHPKAAKFSSLVVGVTSFLIGLFIALILIVTAKQYPSLFSTDTQVKEIVYKLTPVLGFAILVLNVQLSISGVAVGAGWQTYVAFVNLGCYYFFGIPLCLLMAFKFDMGILVNDPIILMNIIWSFAIVRTIFFLPEPHAPHNSSDIYKGLWWGIVAGVILEACIVFWIIYRTNWNKESSIAGERLKEWGGDTRDSQF